jgi:hypothetical protein
MSLQYRYVFLREEIKTESKNDNGIEVGGLDVYASSQNVSQVSQTQNDEVCDLSNQEGADRFTAEVERLNKLADKGT